MHIVLSIFRAVPPPDGTDEEKRRRVRPVRGAVYPAGGSGADPEILRRVQKDRPVGAEKGPVCKAEGAEKA